MHINNLFITGGTGTLGYALVDRYYKQCDITVFSRDPVKQFHMKQVFPNVRFVMGDVRNYNQLSRAMIGHDVVIHTAANKHIPQAEQNVQETIEINVTGSANVAGAALETGVKHVVGVSTDKVCYPINTYGFTKALMERTFQEYSRFGLTKFHLCRYGNVIGSTGSVLQVWNRQMEQGVTPTITERSMTRFWLSIKDAVKIIEQALESPSGTIVIPLAPALSMQQFADYLLPLGQAVEVIGIRPGEKLHESLLTPDERFYIGETDLDWLLLYPRIDGPRNDGDNGYKSGYVSNSPSKWLEASTLRKWVS